MDTLSLYLGRSGTGKSYACYSRIKEIIETCPGEPIILLVPDSATYTTERELAAFMPNGGFTTVRVVGFNRLRYQIFQSTGKVHEKTLSDIGQKLLLRLVMKRDHDKLDILKPVAKQPHFADIMQSLMAECEAFDVSAEDLAKAATGKDLSSTLQRKLSALAQIMGSYEDLVQEKFGSYKSRLQELIDMLPKSPLLKNAHVFVDGFHWFTPLQLTLVENLLDNAKEGVVTITMPTDDREILATKKGSLFGRSKEVYDDILRIYEQKKGLNVEKRFFPDLKNAAPLRFQTKSLENFVHNFFAIPAKSNKEFDLPRLPLMQAYNREREADAVCRQILNLQQSQRRWRDFTIVLRESETYGDVLEKALTRYEIPYFSDRRHPMLSHPLGEFLNGLFEIVNRRFNHDAVFRLLKTDFFPLERLAVDELENYCLEFGIRDYMWLREKWTYRRQGWDKPVEALEADEEEASEFVTTEDLRLQRVNETHEQIMKALKPWWNFARKIHTGAEWCEKLYELMESLKIAETLSAWSEEAESRGEPEEATSHEQMFKKVISFFDEVYQVGFDETLTLEEMAVLLEEGLADVTYSLVPPSLDHVTVTTIERGYTREAPVVFVMGLNEGIFPQRMGDEGLLKDSERQDLQRVGITLAEGALARAFNEQFLFYLACTRAKEQLYLSYAQADADGAAQEPSLLVKRLIQLGYCDDFEVEGGASVIVPLSLPEGLEANYIWRLNQSMSLLAGQFGSLIKGQSSIKYEDSLWRSLYNWAITSWNSPSAGADTNLLSRTVSGVLVKNEVPLITPEVVEGLFLHQNSLTGSVTRIERYQACPFSFYAQYGLKLEPRKIKTLGAPEIGTFLHENLRAIGLKLLQQNKRWADLDEKELKQICQEASDSLADELLGLKDYFGAGSAEVGNQQGNQEDNQKDDQEGNGDEQPELAQQNNSKIMITTMKERLEATLERTVRRLGIWSEHSKFNTKYVEQGFGHGAESPWSPLHIPLHQDKSIRLQGQIDRIDEYTDKDGQTYGLVVDYKSGNAHISAGDIYYGLKLQLITYLLALEKNERVLPAAAVYTAVKNPRLPINSILTEDKFKDAVEADTTLKNSGYYLNDVAKLIDLDDRVAQQVTEFVPIKLTSKGEVYKSNLNKVKTQEEFSLLTGYVEKVISQAGKNILAGNFPISPYNKKGYIPCGYCQYKNVCRFEKLDGTNNYRYLEELNEETGLEKMKGGEVYAVDSGTTSGY